MKKKSLTLYFLNEVLSVLITAIILFLSAGTLNWWPAWAVMIGWVLCFALQDTVILRLHPELLAERLSPPKDAKVWDKVLVSTVRLVQLGRYIVAGLDFRFGWTHNFPVTAQVVGLVLFLAGYGFFVWAMASNTFFSQVVRIQADRGHAVATKGPYKFVRHPGYSGMIVSDLGISIALGSWWAILAAGVVAVLMVVRTALEDRTLHKELEGYSPYAKQVRFKLVPGIW